MIKVIVLVSSLEEKGPIIVAESIGRFSSNKEIEYIYVSLKKNTIYNLKRFERFRVIELNMKKNIFGIISSLKKIKKIIKNEKIDLIHTHCFLPTIIASQLKQIDKVTTLHNNPWEDYVYQYGKIFGNVMAYLELYCNRKNNLNIVISKYLEEVFKKNNLKNIKVIYNGIQTNENLIDFERKEGINLVTVSVLNSRKNLYMAIDIVERLVKRGEKVSLKIIGDGPEKNNLINCVNKKKLEKNIQFLGKISREKIFAEIKKEDIFLFTSKSEGFGLVIAEAMAVGVPSVANKIPVMEELIENKRNGILAKNLKEFEEGIVYIKRNLKYFSESALKIQKEKFEVNLMVNSYEKMYLKLKEDGLN